MSKQRVQKIGEEIKKELSAIIREELKDPRVAAEVISVTGVEVSGDLSYAKVFVSIYGKDVDEEKTLKVFKKSAGFLRTELGKRIRIRHIPELLFQLDKSMEYGDHINKILKDLDLDDNKDEDKDADTE